MKGKISRYAMNRKRYAYTKKLALFWFNGYQFRSKISAHNAYRFLSVLIKSQTDYNTKFLLSLRLSWPEVRDMQKYFFKMCYELRNSKLEKLADQKVVALMEEDRQIKKVKYLKTYRQQLRFPAKD